jgi:hypothetical protein
MRVLNSLKLHSNDAPDGLYLELVADESTQTCCFVFGLKNDVRHRIEPEMARAIMEMCQRTHADPLPFGGKASSA